VFKGSTSFHLTNVLDDECCAPSCHAAPEAEYPTPLCARHIIDVIRAYQAQVTTMAGRPQELPPVEPEQWLRLPDSRTHIVYFLRFGDRVKIGTTTAPERRFKDLPHDEVIGTIPGDVKVERQWHLVWADHRIVGEWFQATPELLAAIHQALTEAA
jgi:hypothetical protein